MTPEQAHAKLLALFNRLIDEHPHWLQERTRQELLDMLFKTSWQEFLRREQKAPLQ